MANIYKNAKLDLTTASATTLYTAPSDSRAIIKSLLVCDDSNNGSTLTVTVTDASSNVFVLFDVKYSLTFLSILYLVSSHRIPKYD